MSRYTDSTRPAAARYRMLEGINTAGASIRPATVATVTAVSKPIEIWWAP